MEFVFYKQFGNEIDYNSKQWKITASELRQIGITPKRIRLMEEEGEIIHLNGAIYWAEEK